MFCYLGSMLRKLQSSPISRKLSVSMHQNVRVQVKPGCLIGKKHLTPNKTVFHSFQGIPYAVPPLGELRYKSPIPLERFAEPVLDCTKERDVSHQRDPIAQAIVGSENCLFLNVFAPQVKRDSDATSSVTHNQSLPVIVYVHGGGFFFWQRKQRLRFMDENVIVVTLNYRLGALGFLALPEENIWGNAGLKDQRLALQWIQENISSFYGDPNNVTLMGESAGAASVHLHTYSSHANKLFHKAIMQSGTANMEWVFTANPIFKTRRMAQLLGCESTDSKEILAFLQSDKVTPMRLLEKSLDVLIPDERRRGLPLAFKPVIEHSNSPDKFIDKPIHEILQQPNILKMPTIIGYNSGEGMAMTINAKRKLAQVDEDLARFIPRNIPLTPENNERELRQLTDRVRKFYFKNQKIDEQQLDALTDLLTDYHFAVDMHNAAEWQVRFQPDAPLFFYRFDYVGGRNMYKYLFQFKHLRGASHGDELFYLFQMAGDEKNLQPEDDLCAQRLCRLWANFARYGRPTVKVESPVIDFEWNAVQKPKNDNRFVLNYLSFGKQCEMRTDPDKERMDFWKNIYNEYKPTDYSRLSAKL